MSTAWSGGEHEGRSRSARPAGGRGRRRPPAEDGPARRRARRPAGSPRPRRGRRGRRRSAPARPLAGRLDAGQHQQRLGVAAHAGGEVVEPEQVGERVGVGLVASSWVMKSIWRPSRFWLRRPRLTKLSAMLRRSTACSTASLQRRVLHGVEGVGHVGHLVAGVHAIGSTSGTVTSWPGAVEDAAHGLGQAVGHGVGLAGQRPQRPGDRPRHDHTVRATMASSARPMNQRWRASAARLSCRPPLLGARASCRSG